MGPMRGGGRGGRGPPFGMQGGGFVGPEGGPPIMGGPNLAPGQMLVLAPGDDEITVVTENLARDRHLPKVNVSKVQSLMLDHIYTQKFSKKDSLQQSDI